MTSQLLPQGGSGDLEYIWLTNTSGSPFSTTNPEWSIIPNATGSTYQPGQLYETTFYIRCSRRVGCSDFIGESNIVSILVNELPNAQFEQAPTSSLCKDETVAFSAANAGGGATYTWNFGTDATPQTASSRSVYNVSWSTQGAKEVSLTVERFGCSLTVYYEVEVADCLNDFQFTEFTAQPMGDPVEVQLDWTTRFEANGGALFVEHSKNGDYFDVVDTRNANGSANQYNSYSAMHVEPSSGLNYYRIKYVDATGSVTYSETEVVAVEDRFNIFVYPNPVVEYVYVEILTDLDKEAVIELVDMNGRVVSTQNGVNGLTTYRIDMTKYAAGSYAVWVRYNGYRKAVEHIIKINE